MKVTLKQAKDLGTKVGVDWKKSKFTPASFRKGLLEEGEEHGNVAKGNMATVAKLVLPHLKKMPDYYEKLDKMEKGK